MAGDQLEIDQDLSLQRRMWHVQRGGWLAMCLLLVAALLGVFGNGPASRSSSDGAGLRLEYERFLRFKAPTALKLRVSSKAANGILPLQVSSEFLEHVRLESVHPQPSRVEAGQLWTTYFFVRSEPDAFTVVFHFKPEAIGRLTGEFKLARGQPLSFLQFVYP